MLDLEILQNLINKNIKIIWLINIYIFASEYCRNDKYINNKLVVALHK